MRVVVDTNVFVSAALKNPSQPALALRLAARHGVILKSASTEAQLLQVLGRPRLAPFLSSKSVAWISQLLAGATPVTITEQITVCRDPTDDKFLELAVSGQADFILSGDADLLVLHPFRGIPILNPAGFIQHVTG
jgi:putative PIN family toxin of toxin-antitoxin system